MKLIYVYNISSLVSIEFVDNIRKLRRRASAKLLQTLLTIGERKCFQTAHSKMLERMADFSMKFTATISRSEVSYDMVKICTELGLPNVEPEGEDGIGIDDPIADDGEGEESDDDTHTASSGRFTVEKNADRRARYLCSTISECSSPGFWQRQHHFDESCSGAGEEEGEDR